MNTLTISVVSHENGSDIETLLDYFTSIESIDVEIIVTINKPEDLSFLNKYSDQNIKLIENKTQKGFSENHNHAFQSATSSNLLILNPDVVICEFNIDQAIAELNTPGTWLVAPEITNESGCSTYRYRNFPTFFNLLRERLSNSEEYQDRITYSKDEIDWVPGCAMLIKCSTFKKLGGFNEKYFLYCEDADLCLKIKRQNKSIQVSNFFQIIHTGRRSSKKSLKYFLIHVKSLLTFNFIYLFSRF